MAQKIIFFLAGPTATENELAQIALLNAMTAAPYEVKVRNTLQSASYDDAIEACDLVAGTIPTAFNAVTGYGTAHVSRPVKLQVIPATAAITGTATQQLSVLKAVGTSIAALTLSTVTAVTTAYASDDTDVATVHSSNGLITGVGAGTCTITATHTYSSGLTVTGTCAVTVTAG